jgi:hypothetical protein
LYFICVDGWLKLAHTDLREQPLVDKKRKSCGTIAFTLERSGQSRALELPRPLGSELEENTRKLDDTSIQLQTIEAAIFGVEKAIDNVGDMYDTWNALVDKIKVVVTIVGTITEVILLFIWHKARR